MFVRRDLSKPHALRWAGASLLAAGGCITPPPTNAVADTGSSGEPTPLSSGSDDEGGTSTGCAESGCGTTSGSSGASESGDTGIATCTADDAPDPACSGETPFCSQGVCVGCADLPADACGTIDAGAPVCDAGSGECVACTVEESSLCAADKLGCVDNTCAPCTANDHCGTGLCDVARSECLVDGVAVTGSVYPYGRLDPEPVREYAIRASQVAAEAIEQPDDDGIYRIEGVPPRSLLDVGISLNGTLTMETRVVRTIPNEVEYALDLPVVQREWLADIASECGLFEDREAALADVDYFIQRSTIVGRFVEEDGEGVAGISRTAMQARMGDWPNFHGNVADTNDDPTFVCFLAENTELGRLEGTTDVASGETGHFVMFRVRNDSAAGIGVGTATVSAGGFDGQAISLQAPGAVGVVELVRNDDPIPRDFATDVYPFFTTHQCISCHTEGSETGAVVDRDGYLSIWDAPARQVWENLVGPGTDCSAAETPQRVCTDDPEASEIFVNPLVPEAGGDETHVSIIASRDDPSLRIILEWIEQGARPPAEVNFVEDIYPLFASNNCVSCHTEGGPGIGGGDFPADWSLTPEEVYQNLVGPGTECSDPDEPLRVCVNDPENSLLVRRPLADDDMHVSVFLSPEDPGVQRIRQWIAQGATFPE